MSPNPRSTHIFGHGSVHNLGIGDSQCSIDNLLNVVLQVKAQLPKDLERQLPLTLTGYVGGDCET
jgi:hypothetical protein